MVLKVASAGTSYVPRPLKRVDTLKYLGIVITTQPTQFIDRNIEPTIATLQRNVHCRVALANLPLSLINLINIKFLPKFNYFFKNSPWVGRHPDSN